MTAPERSFICPVCNVDRVGPAIENLSDRRKGLRGAWEIVKCYSCGTCFLNPMPTDTELSGYYSSYTKEERVVLQTGAGSKAPIARRIYHKLSGDVDPRDFVQVPPGGKVLDYGSGNGTYLSYFNSQGIDIVGADISDVMVQGCLDAGLSMRRVDNFDEIPFDDHEFDVVYLMQVFEHLRGPRRFMQELSRVIKPGGTLHLALPNASSSWRRFFGRNWVSGWFAPFHLVHYTSESLSQLAAEYGLVPIHSWSRTPESWFRLNLKAALQPNDNQVEKRHALVDSFAGRFLLMFTLRVVECFIRERDCLVMSFRKV